jgi:hypothetical protein
MPAIVGAGAAGAAAGAGSLPRRTRPDRAIDTRHDTPPAPTPPGAPRPGRRADRIARALAPPRRAAVLGPAAVAAATVAVTLGASGLLGGNDPSPILDTGIAPVRAPADVPDGEAAAIVAELRAAARTARQRRLAALREAADEPAPPPVPEDAPAGDAAGDPDAADEAPGTDAAGAGSGPQQPAATTPQTPTSGTTAPATTTPRTSTPSGSGRRTGTDGETRPGPSRQPPPTAERDAPEVVGRPDTSTAPAQPAEPGPDAP